MLAHAGAADESLSVALLLAALWVGWIGWQRLKGRGFGRLPRAGALALVGVAVVVAVGAAWLPQQIFPPGAAPTGAAPGPRISSTATLSFAKPAGDAHVAGDQLEVALDLNGGSVVTGTSTELSPGEGHLHLKVDGQLVSMTYGEVQVVDMRPWGPGRHTIEAEFVAADHLPFDPPVVATVDVMKGVSGVRRGGAVLLLGLMATLALPGPAAAHAGFVASDPADGATLADAPRTVTIEFTETPDLALSSIRVFDAGGTELDIGEPGAVGEHGLAVTLPSDLGDGVYTVAWSVVSTEDGHRTANSFAFGVGEAPPPPGSGGSVENLTQPTPLSVASKSLLYAGCMLLVAAGVVGMGVFGGRPKRLAAVALAAGLAAFAGAIGMLLAEQRAVEVPMNDLVASAAGRPYVRLLGLTLIAGGLAALSAARPRWRSLVVAAAAFAAAAMYVRAASGHASALDPAWTQELIQWFHFLAAGVWIGGIVLLALVLRESEPPPAGSVRRYSNVAVVAVVVVVGTGFARAWGQLGGPGGLLDSLGTAYGRTLGVKIVVAVAIIALGAVNRRRHVADADADRAPFRRILRAEIVGAAGVILLTATLTGLDPSAAAGRTPTTAIPVLGRAQGTDFATTTRMTVVLTPGTAGTNAILAEVLGYDDGQPLDADAVSLTVASVTAHGLPSTSVDLARDGDGWSAQSTAISAAGTWRITGHVTTGADAVEVPMVLVTRSDALDPPTPGARLSTARYASGVSLQLSLEVATPDEAFVHITALTPDGSELPLTSAVVVATRDGAEALRIVPEQATPGHFIGTLPPLEAGSWTIDAVATAEDGRAFQATLVEISIA